MPSLLMPRAVLSGHLATVSLITVLIANFKIVSKMIAMEMSTIFQCDGNLTQLDQVNTANLLFEL